jgi:chromosome segregation ATPase
MTRYVSPTVFGVLALLCATSMWGCNQQKANPLAVKVRDLETRYSKLEEDFRTLQTSNEQTRKRLNAAEAQRASLEQEKTELTTKLDTVTGERDGLKKQVTVRTTERDSAQANLMQFSKDLQALAGRVESALNENAAPNTTIIPASRRNE